MLERLLSILEDRLLKNIGIITLISSSFVFYGMAFSVPPPHKVPQETVHVRSVLISGTSVCDVFELPEDHLPMEIVVRRGAYYLTYRRPAYFWGVVEARKFLRVGVVDYDIVDVCNDQRNRNDT